jgi:hypothetical protein
MLVAGLAITERWNRWSSVFRFPRHYFAVEPDDSLYPNLRCQLRDAFRPSEMPGILGLPPFGHCPSTQRTGKYDWPALPGRIYPTSPRRQISAFR